MRIIAERNDVVHALVMLDVRFQNAVQNMIFRQAVAILLIRPQFGGRRFVNRILRNQVVSGEIVPVLRQRIDCRFRHVGNNPQAARHVAVKRGIADADFGFVAGRQRQIAEFIGKRHQNAAPAAGLQIFFRDIRLPPGERFAELPDKRLVHRRNRNDVTLDAEMLDKAFGVVHASLR